MAKNDWARNAFRKAQNLMSRGYNDFEPATVVTKNELSNLKNTLLDDDKATQPANGWTNLDDELIYPSHLNGKKEKTWGMANGLGSIGTVGTNPILDAAEDALGLAGVSHAFTEDDPVKDLEEDLEETLEELDDDTDDFNEYTSDAFKRWESIYNTPDSPALTATQAKQGANLASREINRLKKSLKKAKAESKEKIQDRIDQVTNIKDRLSQ